MRERAVGLPAALVAGLLVGVLGTFKHQVGVSAVTGTGAPVGLVLALLMVALFLAAVRLTLPWRGYAVAAAVGLLVGVGVLLLPGPGGSKVVLADAVGEVWPAGALVVAVVAVAVPGRRRRRGGRQDADGILVEGSADGGDGRGTP